MITDIREVFAWMPAHYEDKDAATFSADLYALYEAAQVVAPQVDEVANGHKHKMPLVALVKAIEKIRNQTHKIRVGDTIMLPEALGQLVGKISHEDGSKGEWAVLLDLPGSDRKYALIYVDKDLVTYVEE